MFKPLTIFPLERPEKTRQKVGTGDLGTTAKEVEQTLETNFTLASRWGCILLLDEADVFLAERTKEDFKRNGLVAGEHIHGALCRIHGANEALQPSSAS
ncbi:AAA family ATPase [Ilyonectria robusta]